MTTSSPPLLPTLAVPPTRGRIWKISLCLLLIFLAGTAIGAVVTLRVLRYEVSRRSNPATWTKLLLDKVDHEVHLTPDQRRALEPIVRSGVDEFQQVRIQAFMETAAIVERARAKAEPTLSPDQQHRLDAFIKNRSDLIRRWAGDQTPVPPAASPSPAVP